jgi:hypothetical protein
VVSLVPGPCYGWLGPYSGGSGPHPMDPTRYLGVSYRTRGSGSCVQGSGAYSWRSGPTDCIPGYTIFSGHVAPLEPSTWWGQVLFTVRLEIAARAPYLHTVVRGTPDSGYRHTPYSLTALAVIVYGQIEKGKGFVHRIFPFLQTITTVCSANICCQLRSIKTKNIN